MGWIAISDAEEHRFCAEGMFREVDPAAPGAVATASQLDCPMPQGSMMIESRLSPDGRPQTLLAFERAYPRPYKLTLQALPGGGLVLVIADGVDVFHTALHHDSQDRADILRISYSWARNTSGTGPAHRGRLSIERPEYDSVTTVELQSARPLMLEDVRIIATDPRRRLLDEDVQFFAVSDEVEPVGPMPCLTANVPILARGGYAHAGDLRRGDMVETLESGVVPVLQAVRRTVPACGSFRPVRLRAPYFGLIRDIVVAPDQRLVVGGSEVEYTFGREAVLVPARHLVNGISAIQLTGAVTVSYTQLILPRHESVIAAGCPVESLYLGRLRRKPGPLAASLLAGADRRMLPEHARSAYLMIKPFEAITLMQRRAA
ncbi:Hint domain-containing protein [Alisedimentitalea sp. MJ-SS2]|uniref:Hint domain-containing protein n=1 Tax=Aliisedimentitalea sp. MJ-SS2 TaxID=3049795 RepID=UPI00290A207F|nr:Hint domain-containing protein [Alisedimentitalea sp. MJ-SS2]MDU8927550.1 Hint domain-containing protein [Alisedimentitalea sp. MJ-SS2]